MSTQISRDDRYEALAYEYLQVQTAILDRVLQSNRVADAESRQAICAEFLSELGILHDQQSIEAESLTAYPLICFSEQFLDVDSNTDDLGTVFAPSPSFSFGEQAYGAVADAFGDDTADASQDGDRSAAELREIEAWLTSVCSVEEAEEYCNERDARGDICRTPGTWLGLLHVELLAQPLPNDTLWWYQADSEAWAALRGSMGIALVRNNRVVAFIQTGHS